MSLEIVQLEKAIKELPPLPTSTTEIMEILNQEEVHFNLLEDKVSTDPTLAARILTVANSPFYGFGGRIDSIKQACTILGFHTTRNIVMAAGIMSKFDAEHFNRLDLKALWQHSVGTGIAAKVLSKRISVDPEQAFLAGLLHDIGKMAMNTFFSEDYTPVLDYRDEQDCLLVEAEANILGFNHATVGALMARHWKLPGEIINAIEFHHQPESDQATPVARLLHVADITSRTINIGNGGDSQIPALNPDIMKQLGLDDDIIQQAIPKIEEMNATASAFAE